LKCCIGARFSKTKEELYTHANDLSTENCGKLREKIAGRGEHRK
jgi:hypothetical protein